jgi:hypothetical protein
MTAWMRWQDWAVVALGVALFVTPLVFGETSHAAAASTTYVLGASVALAGLMNASTRRASGLELVPAAVAVVLFISPWVFGFSAVTALAWSAWIIAVLIVVTLGTMYGMQNRRSMA